MSPDDQSDPDPSRVQRQARERQRDRAESVEEMSARLDEVLGESTYPVSSEQLAVEYADQPMDLPNETESLGSVFDRIVDEQFESPTEAREAVLNELTGETGGPAEYNDERPLEPIEESDPGDEPGGEVGGEPGSEVGDEASSGYGDEAE